MGCCGAATVVVEPVPTAVSPPTGSSETSSRSSQSLMSSSSGPLLSFAALAAASWLLFNDYMDYGRGLHPFLPWPGLEAYAGGVAVGLSLASLALAVAWPSWLGRARS